MLGNRALTGIGPSYKDSRHYLSDLLPLAMLHLVKALHHSKIVSQTRDHIFKHMSLEGTFHTQNTTSDCGFLHPGHLVFSTSCALQVGSIMTCFGQ